MLNPFPEFAMELKSRGITNPYEALAEMLQSDWFYVFAQNYYELNRQAFLNIFYCGVMDVFGQIPDAEKTQAAKEHYATEFANWFLTGIKGYFPGELKLNPN